MKRLIVTTCTTILMCVLLGGCGKPNMEGIILEVNDQCVKLATDLTLEEYEEIKDESVLNIQNEDVYENKHRGLIDLTYKDTEGLNNGDEVEVWIHGDILESYPAQADAKKIKLKE